MVFAAYQYNGIGLGMVQVSSEAQVDYNAMITQEHTECERLGVPLTDCSTIFTATILGQPSVQLGLSFNPSIELRANNILGKGGDGILMAPECEAPKLQLVADASSLNVTPVNSTATFSCNVVNTVIPPPFSHRDYTISGTIDLTKSTPVVTITKIVPYQQK